MGHSWTLFKYHNVKASCSYIMLLLLLPCVQEIVTCYVKNSSFRTMSDDPDEKAVITVEGSALGLKDGGEFSPLANFYFSIKTFVTSGDFDIGQYINLFFLKSFFT